MTALQLLLTQNLLCFSERRELWDSGVQQRTAVAGK